MDIWLRTLTCKLTSVIRDKSTWPTSNTASLHTIRWDEIKKEISYNQIELAPSIDMPKTNRSRKISVGQCGISAG
jgi:hypothetical protein